MYPPTLHVLGFRYRGPRETLSVAGVRYEMFGQAARRDVYVFARPWALPFLKLWEAVMGAFMRWTLPLAMMEWRAHKRSPTTIPNPEMKTCWQVLKQWVERDG